MSNNKKETIIILSHCTFDDSPYCSYVHNHAKALVERGYRVIVLAIISWFPILSNFQKYKKNFMGKIKNTKRNKIIDGVEVIYKKAFSVSNLLYDSQINLNGIFYYNSIKKLFKKLQKENDIVLIDAHTFKVEGYVASRLKRKYPNIVTTVTLHGTSFFRNTKTKNGIKSIQKIFSNVDYAVCVSKKIKDIVENIKVKNCVIIFNGINQYELEKMDKEKYRNNIITVGSLIPQKNQDITIKAVKRLLIDYPKIQLTIVGSGIEKNNLIDLVYKEQIEDNVHFMNRISNKEVLNLMNKSYIFILPSVAEGFGIVYAEAMEAGCITIGTKNEGIDGFIINEKNGFLVNPNEDEIVKLLKDIYSNKYDIKQIRLKAFKDVNELTWENNAQRYIDILTNDFLRKER